MLVFLLGVSEEFFVALVEEAEADFVVIDNRTVVKSEVIKYILKSSSLFKVCCLVKYTAIGQLEGANSCGCMNHNAKTCPPALRHISRPPRRERMHAIWHETSDTLAM